MTSTSKVIIITFSLQLSYTNNPGCESYNFSITYLKAEGPNDTLHYLWDFSRSPTLFLVLTGKNVKLNVNCEDFATGVEHSFNFTQIPKYEFSLIFHKVTVRKEWKLTRKMIRNDEKFEILFVYFFSILVNRI